MQDSIFRELVHTAVAGDAVTPGKTRDEDASAEAAAARTRRSPWSCFERREDELHVFRSSHFLSTPYLAPVPRAGCRPAAAARISAHTRDAPAAARTTLQYSHYQEACPRFLYYLGTVVHDIIFERAERSRRRQR